MIFEGESSPNSEGQYLLNLSSITKSGSIVRDIEEVEEYEESEEGGLITRGYKGEFHRSHHKKRELSVTDWFNVFCDEQCKGNEAKAREMVEKYHHHNSNPDSSNTADGMLCTFMSLGCSEDCLRAVFNVGYPRLNRIKQGLAKTKSSGHNKKSMGSVEQTHLKDFIENGIQVEEGYPCAHRRMKVRMNLVK